MPKPFLTSAQFRRLVALNRKINRVLGFETIAANRDARTGAFVKSGTVNGDALRKVWSIPPRHGRVPVNPTREAFKRDLLTALRGSRSAE